MGMHRVQGDAKFLRDLLDGVLWAYLSLLSLRRSPNLEPAVVVGDGFFVRKLSEIA